MAGLAGLVARRPNICLNGKKAMADTTEMRVVNSRIGYGATGST